MTAYSIPHVGRGVRDAFPTLIPRLNPTLAPSFTNAAKSTTLRASVVQRIDLKPSVMTDKQPPPPANRPAPILILFVIFPILGIIIALSLALTEGGGSNAPATPLPVTSPPLATARPSLINQPAPNFSLPGLDGETYRLSNDRGRVVFLNFWATWCEPCQRELPTFEQFMSEQPSDGAIIVAVNVGEPADAIRTYYEQYKISGLLTLLDSELAAYTEYDVQVMPTTFIIDAGGVVRAKHLGELHREELLAYVEQAGQG